MGGNKLSALPEGVMWRTVWDGDVVRLQQVLALPFILPLLLQASLPSHIAYSSPSLSGSQAHKSRDQRHRGPSLSFLPPIDKGLFVLLRDANFYCSVKTHGGCQLPLQCPAGTALKAQVHTDTHKTSVKLLLLLIYCYFLLSFIFMHLKLWETKATSQFTGRCPLLTAPFLPFHRH